MYIHICSRCHGEQAEWRLCSVVLITHGQNEGFLISSLEAHAFASCNCIRFGGPQLTPEPTKISEAATLQVRIAIVISFGRWQ